MTSPILCNLCGASQYYLVHQGEKPEAGSSKKTNYSISASHLEKPDKIVRCMTCRLVYAIPKGSTQKLIEDYVTMEDPEYVEEEKGRRAQARLILSLIAQYKKAGALLDIGCGPGFFLDEAKKKGWSAHGVDLSAWAKEHARLNFDIPVFQGTLNEAQFPDRHFDVIVMNDVIEHLEDPKSALKEIRRVLKNDGILYISTPDIESFLSRLLRAKWWGINKYHLFYFSRKTIEKMFLEAGLKSVRYAPYPRVFSWNYWVKRLRAYPGFIYGLSAFFSKLGNSERLLTIVLHDQIGVIAKKIPRLDLFENEVSSDRNPPKKMKVIAVLPSYNAEKTLERTVADIPRGLVSEILLVDDASKDRTVEIGKKLGLTVYEHPKNRGYGQQYTYYL